MKICFWSESVLKVIMTFQNLNQFIIITIIRAIKLRLAT